jgi:hypothetical protein
MPGEPKVEGESGRRFETISDEPKGWSATNQRKPTAYSFAEPSVIFDLVVGWSKSRKRPNRLWSETD